MYNQSTKIREVPMPGTKKKKKRKSSRRKKNGDHELCNPFSFLSEKKEKAIQFRIGGGLLSWIDDHAKDMNLTRSGVIIQALVEYAGKIEGLKEARSHAALDSLLKTMPCQVRLEPLGDGSFSMDLVKPGVVRLDGEEDQPNKGEGNG
jgi:hypothetical protein